ncbi:hypothetical protein CRE_23048 [Caenorhabditis remanei]|uniref:F-box domain-containing protein n=1 Tax=Caenorhabditis remanei TaxID=31234 RepID=E3N9D4_CAERE|nr:hypothetical protein CRE_23048 [Caenorhabditis remanei]
MEPTLQLLQLPETAIFKVIKNFPLRQLFEFSLVSSKTKKLVSSLGLEASDVDIYIWGSIRAAVYIGENYLDLDFYTDLNNLIATADMTLPVDAHFDFEGTRIQSSTPFNFSNWLDHIQSVFCCKKPLDVYFCQGSERFELRSLKEAIGNVNAFHVSSELTDAYTKEVLKFLNAPSNMSLVRNPFEEVCQIQQVFIQNFEIIKFDDVFSLDDMLLINSQKVRFGRPTTHKQFNKFVKHWIRGSNPRLQRMSVSIDITDSVSREMLLKGIQCVDVAEEEQQEICQTHGIVSDDMVEIRRKDGTPAVIATKDFQNVLYICFIAVH